MKQGFNDKKYLWNTAEKDSHIIAIRAWDVGESRIIFEKNPNLDTLRDYIVNLREYFSVLKPFMLAEYIPDSVKKKLKNGEESFFMSGIWKYWNFYTDLFKEIKNLEEKYSNNLKYNISNKKILDELTEKLTIIRESLDLLKQDKIGIPAQRVANPVTNTKARFKNYNFVKPDDL